MTFLSIGIRRNLDTQVGVAASDRLGIPASEPVAAVGYPPAKDADGNGGKKRPHDGQSEVCYQPEQNENAPEDLAFHSSILARVTAF